MFAIIRSERLAPGIQRLVINAPRIARKQRAGQFVIVRVHDHGERIPLTIADADASQGTITLIVQGIGKTTKLINSLPAGQYLLDVVGPLGHPSELGPFGTAVVMGGGVGTAIAWPTARALREQGNRIVTILGARTRELLILEDELRSLSDPLIVMTDDGSYGRKGLVTEPLREWIEAGQPVDYVLAIGPIPMMRGVADVTRVHGIPTVVSLNSIMVDGTGMCGGCRVLVGNAVRFACVDGPEFNAHEVDFEVLARRNGIYREAEAQALQRFEENPETDRQRVGELCRLAETHPELTLP